jgi:hypothetical protein
MKISNGTLMAAALLAAGIFGATNSKAETVVIPYSAALQGNQGQDDPANNCSPNLSWPAADYRFSSIGISDCRLDFPLQIPVGHTIQQISVIHGTNTLWYANGAIDAKLVVMSFQAPMQTTTTMFDWSAMGNWLIDSHPLMAQLVTQYGTVYLEQFQDLPNKAYEVEVALSPGAQVSAIAITYN